MNKTAGGQRVRKLSLKESRSEISAVSSKNVSDNRKATHQPRTSPKLKPENISELAKTVCTLANAGLVERAGPDPQARRRKAYNLLVSKGWDAMLITLPAAEEYQAQ